MVDVFISYSRATRSRVEPIKRKLETLGLDCFFDMHQIDGGANFPDVIDRALRDSRSVLCCWSPLYFKGQWSMIECRDAIARSIIVPVAVERFEQFAPPADLRQLNWFDLVDWNGDDDHEDWQRTLQNLGKFVGRDLLGSGQETNRRAAASANPASAAFIANSLGEGTLEDLRATWTGLAAGHDIGAVERFFQHVQAAVPGSGLEFEIESHLDWLRQEAERRAKIAETAKAELLAKRAREDEARRSEATARLEPGKVWCDIIPGMPVDTLPEMVTVAPVNAATDAPASDGQGGAIEDCFALARYPVTYADFDAAIAVGADMERPADQGKGRGRRAAVNVSRTDARAYVDWLNERLGLSGRDGAYRLPSSSEWEYAFGASVSPCKDRAHGQDAGSCWSNSLGLHCAREDLWEWCEIGDNSHAMPDERGGQLQQPVAMCMQLRQVGSPTRAEMDPATRRDDIGFRLARTLPQGNSPRTA